MQNKLNYTIAGFTLAEVLITLGVLASITIPGLINTINDIQYKTAWKKINETGISPFCSTTTHAHCNYAIGRLYGIDYLKNN